MTTELGKAHRRYVARLASGFENSYAIPISEARKGKPERLVNCLRAQKPLSHDDYDLLAEFVGDRFKPVGNATLTDVHEVVALVRTLKQIWRDQHGRTRLPNEEVERLISYASASVERFSGVAIDPEKVRDLLRRPVSRMK